MAGAAIATVISRYLYLISLSIFAKKKLSIEFKLSYLTKPLLASLVMFFILFIFNNYIEDMNIILGIFEVILGIIIYFTVMFLIKGVTKEEFLLR